MNTLAAFELARAQGADGIELDVRLSRDGHLVVIHDDLVDATTDGQGKVSELSLTELKQLDAGAWFDDEFAGETIPTLDDVFDAFGERLWVNVEIKASRELINRLERRLADCIRRHNMRDRVIISCFDPVVLQRVRAMMPVVMTGFLHQPETTAEHDIALDELRHDARHPRHDMVDAEYMSWARAQGYFVCVWTVNEPERALQLRSSASMSSLLMSHARSSAL